ncbi:MAG: M23 family metallopeptidase [Chloroflexi bacterium]|nr:M23 family metallopeptidase [Chloroflexota bacterium]
MSPLSGKGIWTLFTDVDEAVKRAPQVGAKHILCKVSNRGAYAATPAREALRKVAAVPGLVPVAWMYNYLENVEAEAVCIGRALADGFAAMILDAEASLNGKFDAARALVERVKSIGVDLSRLYLCSDPRLDTKIDEIPTTILAQICRGGFIPMIYGELLPSDKPNAAKRVMQAAYDQYARHQVELNYADPLMPALAPYWDNQGQAQMNHDEFKAWCDEAIAREPDLITLYRAGVTSDGAWRAFGEFVAVSDDDLGPMDAAPATIPAVPVPAASTPLPPPHLPAPLKPPTPRVPPHPAPEPAAAPPAPPPAPQPAPLVAPPKHDPFPLLGLRDREGGEWLANQGLRGWCVDTVDVGLTPRRLGYTALAEKGIRVIVRLTYGSGGAGTLPIEDQYAAFAGAVVGTIKNSPGAYAFILGNEPNNPDEWPGGENGGKPITPEQYGQLWNTVWWRIPKTAMLIPAAIDPYYGPNSNPREYWARMMLAIYRGDGARRGGADGLAFHAKVQWHDKTLVRSTATYGDPPLAAMPLHWRAWQAVWDKTPNQFKSLPVFLTECNPERQVPNGPLGWRNTDAGLIGEMIAFEREMNIKYSDRVKAVVFYRWPARDEWGMMNKPSLVDAIQAAARDVATEHREVLVPQSAPFFWPTESHVVTQRWGINRQSYARWGLPGHEGVDIKASNGSRIFAAYSGTITRIDENNRAYGYSIRQKIELDGRTYELIYAHGLTGSKQVNVGDEVRIGQELMKADSTGNSTGPHLHFAMKEPGVTYVDKDADGNDRQWPWNLRDPSPFLGI